jgi:uncharacterized peroxidase-related enzyme
MQRIPALEPNLAPAASRSILEAVQKKIGMAPNIHRTLAHAPAVLASYVQQNETLAGGVLPAALREQIALAVAGRNGCDYCASAHTLIGKGAGLTPAQASDALRGRTTDVRTQAALNFVAAVLEQRGHVRDADLAAVRASGYGDAEIVEFVAHVAINIFTNYLNSVAQTDIDFPLVRAGALAPAA